MGGYDAICVLYSVGTSNLTNALVRCASAMYM